MISNKHNNQKELKMARTRKRINKMQFQKQARRCEPLEPLSDEDKYIVKMSGYKKGLIGQTDEKIPRFANSFA